MRKVIALGLAGLLAMLLFSCDGSTQEDTITQTAASVADEAMGETTPELPAVALDDDEPTTEATITTQTTTALTREQIFASGTYTLRANTEDGPIFVVANGRDFMVESSLDAMVDVSDPAYDLVGSVVRTIFYHGNATITFPQRQRYLDSSIFLAIEEDVMELNISNFDTLHIISLVPTADLRYFNTQGFTRLNVSEMLLLFSGDETLPSQPSQPSQPSAQRNPFAWLPHPFWWLR